MRIGLLTDGGYPYATGESRLWCDRLVRGLEDHEFDVHAFGRSAHQERYGLVELPPQVRSVRTAPLWTPPAEGRPYGRRDRRAFAAHFHQLALALCDESADSFADGLYGLAELAVSRGGPATALRSETAARILESACRVPGARRGVRDATVPDHLAFVGQLERALRPLSADWYDEGGQLAGADLCHATAGGPAALAGLLVKRFFGVPLLLTEYGAHLRTHYLTSARAAGADEALRRAPVRALTAAFHGRLAAEAYGTASVVTSGNDHTRRWQERCGGRSDTLRTVHPGMECDRFAAVGEGDDEGAPDTLVWVGRVEPAKDLVSLLHAFAEVRLARQGLRLRLFCAPTGEGEEAAYLAHCRAVAAQLFPDEAADARAVGENPVTFEEIGGPEAPELPDAYAAGAVVVLSSAVEGFPIGLVEAMFCARATVSTDVGAVVEVVGDTGLVVPPHNPKALADACLGLLRDPARRRRLGAAARARALERFTVDQNVAAFRAAYLDIVSHTPVRRPTRDGGAAGAPLPFATPAEAHVPVRWTTLPTPAREAVTAAPGARSGDV